MVVKNVEKKENNTAIFQVEIDAEAFEQAVNKAYRKLKYLKQAPPAAGDGDSSTDK